MWVAQGHADELRRWYGLQGPVSAFSIAQRCDLVPFYCPIPGPFCAMTIYPFVAIDKHLNRGDAEHTLLHEIGHWKMHGLHGSHRFWDEHGVRMLSKIEEQAEHFAYFAALPGDELLALLWTEVPEWEIAERYGRSVRWLRERIRLALAAGELYEWRVGVAA